MNIELAEKVLEHIKEHREAFNINCFIDIDDYDDYEIFGYPCGTKACIAGWTILLSQNNTPFTEENFKALVNREWELIRSEASMLLDITPDEGENLFVPEACPFADDDDAIARFEEFIKKKIKEGFKD